MSDRDLDGLLERCRKVHADCTLKAKRAGDIFTQAAGVIHRLADAVRELQESNELRGRAIDEGNAARDRERQAREKAEAERDDLRGKVHETEAASAEIQGEYRKRAEQAEAMAAEWEARYRAAEPVLRQRAEQAEAERDDVLENYLATQAWLAEMRLCANCGCSLRSCEWSRKERNALACCPECSHPALGQDDE